MNKLSMAVTAALAMSASSAMACNCGPARTPLTTVPKALTVTAAPVTAAPVALTTRHEPVLAVATDDRWVGTRAGRSLDARAPARLAALRGEEEDEVALAEPVKLAKADAQVKSDAGDRRDTRKRDDDDRPSRSQSGGMNFGAMTFFGAGGAGSSGAPSKPAEVGTPSPTVAATSPVVTMTSPTPTPGSSKPSTTTFTSTTPTTVTAGTSSGKPSNDKPSYDKPSYDKPSNDKPAAAPNKGEQYATSNHKGDGHQGDWNKGDSHKGDSHKGGTSTAMSQYAPVYLPATRVWPYPQASAPRYGFFDTNNDGKADVYGVVWADLNHLNKTGTAAKPGTMDPLYKGWTDPNAGAPVYGWFDKNNDGVPESYGVVWADTRHTPAGQTGTSWTQNKPGNGHGGGHGHGGGGGGHGHGHGHDGHGGRPPVSKH